MKYKDIILILSLVLVIFATLMTYKYKSLAIQRDVCMNMSTLPIIVFTDKYGNIHCYRKEQRK